MTHIPDDTFERAKKHFLSGLQHVLHENWSDAEREFRISLTHHPNRISTLVNLSAVLIRLGRLGEAHALLERGYLVDPLNRELLLNHGLLLFEERQYERAIAFYDRLLEREPSCAEAWLNRGVCLGALGLPEAAIASYDRSIEINPNYAEAWSNRGVAFNDLGLQAEALVSYARAAELKPDASGALGALVHARMKICDWVDFDRHRETIEKKITIGDLVVYPFAFLGLCEEPSLQRQCAELFSKQKYGSISQFGQVTNRGNSRKIRVGYFSMDFREHPVAHLIAELIEMHDRKRFEIWGFSFGFNTGDTMRKRLERAFDRFFDVRSLNDLKIAQLARENAIDIAVDLGGYTQGSRPAIFVHRAAPIQINYLGFPGTMGAPVMDYLVADPIVIPTDFQSNFSEKIIYLPDSYQVNDSKRLVSNRPITREEFGLPKSSFVFCCFSSSWKILPATFAAWARILRSTPNTTLWLYEDNLDVKQNLLNEAEKHGVNPIRLVFAKHLSHAEHLARYKLADLFLDTFPYGAHTTASDALWMGLPVITRTGKSFASRVASSLLCSVGVPELITQTVEEYESLAIELATSTEGTEKLKERLITNRASCALFNTTLFTQHIEAGYVAAHKRQLAGLPPEHILVRPPHLEG